MGFHQIDTYNVTVKKRVVFLTPAPPLFYPPFSTVIELKNLVNKSKLSIFASSQVS